jgi:hypothetical protein
MSYEEETDPPGLTDGLDESNVDATPGISSPSKGWLKLISDAEKTFHSYQTKSDNIDKQYANLERLAALNRDREIQLFWANVSVMAPSTYSRPPVPVVVPRFKADGELPRTASEMLERATIVMFERENVDGEMRLIRDDLVILARGAAWLRLEGTNKVCIDQADRKDWLCEAARKWKEVDWVAKRSWLTEPEARKRFRKASGDAYKSLSYSVRKDAEADKDDGASKAGIWELWCKSRNKVVWVSEGAEVCLDEGPPHLKLEDFFPCPRPAFGTLQRRSLVPVPDMLFYKDQLEEINEITARIAALTQALQVRGFYGAGAGEVGDAVEKAIKSTSNNALLVPIANLSGLSGVALKDAIAWLPTDVISATITAIVALRKELINDVYEVTGLSDIMRGQTEASETLGAQQLKSQYGSVRIKDRQDELTRVARDITRITAEIMAEHFSGEVLMEMSQMTLPSAREIEAKAAPLKADLAKVQAELPKLQAQMAQLQQEVAHAQQDPEVHQMAAEKPQEAQQVVQQIQQQMAADQQKAQQMQAAGQQAEQQLQALEATITIEKVMKLLRAEKLRPFILDIETDSTITPDENAAKQRATEFVTAVGGYMKNAMPLVETMPQSAAMVAETLKFITNQYRAGRELQGVIDKFADEMKAKAEQPPAPNPALVEAQQKAQQAAAKTQADTAKQQSDAQIAQGKLQMEHEKQQFEQQQAATQQQIDAQAAQDAHALASQKLRLDGAVHAAKTAETDQKHALEMRKAELASLTQIEVARIGAKQDADSVAITSQLEALLGFAQMAHEKQQQAQEQIHEADLAAADQAHTQELATQGHEASVAAAAAKPAPGAK